MDLKNIPQHIAIIMDGNGRWAKQKHLPRAAGHREGIESLREVVKACKELGVKYLTVYAFSTENWMRPKQEVGFLMGLFMRFLNKEVKDLHKNEVRVRFLGRLQNFSKALQEKMAWAMELTQKNQRLNLNVMMSYGGRAEIIDAIKQIIKEGKKAEEISEESLSGYLYTQGIPDPDLLIRTAAEMRISNFLLWQSAYTELYVTPVLWPDFRRKQLIEAVDAYQKRVRKFGKTEEQVKK
jgi:undecaprenyl diphosphate synthase